MDVLRALNDPVRWSIVQQLGEVDELACSWLERTLSVSKPTITYHTKILVQAGVMTVRKRGRATFYTLHPETLQSLAKEIQALIPGAAPGRDGTVDFPSITDSHPQSRSVYPDNIRPSFTTEEQDEFVLTW